MTALRPFFLLQHGNHGAARDMLLLETALRERFAEVDPLIFRPSCSEGRRTHDGIEVLAGRLVVAVNEFLRSIPETERPLGLIVIGHSLGGLTTRAALHGMLAANQRLIPIAYVSLSTPHLGSRRPRGGVLTGAWRAAVHGLVGNLYGPTGLDLLLEPAEGKSVPLLLELSEPDGDHIKALRRFQSVTFVAAPHGDMQVPFCAASARSHNPYPPLPALPPAMEVAGHSGFSETHAAVLRPLESPNAQCCGTPLAPHRSGDLELQSDNYLEVEFRHDLLEKLTQALPALRRLDVQFFPATRLTVHDSFIAKGPFANGLGKPFLQLLARLLQIDFENAAG
eukprot:TRINITY_DN29085_c0_g1_i1.p1 TRINITY_DN29085_c0_g1~~TRINITY_DN29085_c0_g1_i1.p1  ORF type:complete len:338 (+),score=35.75 TRINITY_DN29085_c0_g1_i1:39-1052(+)